MQIYLINFKNINIKDNDNIKFLLAQIKKMLNIVIVIKLVINKIIQLTKITIGEIRLDISIKKV